MKAAAHMGFKELGRTGVQLPEIGLGTWHFGAGPEVLRAGLDAGALFIDTAETYGTESIVGEAIAGRRAQVFVATKVSPSHFRHTDLLQAAEASLQRLRTNYIDLYQLHEPNPSVPIGETMAAMEELVDAGKVRFIGVSNFSVPEMCAAQQALRKYPLVSNQVRFNLADRTIANQVLPWCQANGVTVIAYSPLAREFQRIRDCDPEGVLASLGRETGRTAAQIALNWCLCQERVIAIPKANSINHILENCAASGWHLNAEQLQRLNERIRFRQRGRIDRLVRRYMPRRLTGVIKSCIALLPTALRRRVT